LIDNDRKKNEEEQKNKDYIDLTANLFFVTTHPQDQ